MSLVMVGSAEKGGLVGVGQQIDKGQLDDLVEQRRPHHIHQRSDRVSRVGQVGNHSQREENDVEEDQDSQAGDLEKYSH